MSISKEEWVKGLDESTTSKWADLTVMLGDKEIQGVKPTEYKAELINPELLPAWENTCQEFVEAQSEMRELTYLYAEEIGLKRDQFIIDALAAKGFVFENKAELAEFAKDRCTRTFNPSTMKYTLYVDEDIAICSWYNTRKMTVSECGTKIKVEAGFKP